MSGKLYADAGTRQRTREIYFSHLLMDDEAKDVMMQFPSIGHETIEFSVGENLDRPGEILRNYVKRMGSWVDGRPFSVHGPFLDLNPGSYDTLIAEATMQRFRTCYRLSKELGADRIVFHAGFVPMVYYEEGWAQKCSTFWKRFLEDTDGSIQIHLENVLDLHWESVAKTLDLVGCPHFSACLDVGHAHVYSEQSVLAWIRGLSGRIGHFHFHDNAADRDRHLAIGEGTIPFDEVFSLADKLAPLASVTVENCTRERTLQSLQKLPWL